jgi:hypothetical protein
LETELKVRLTSERKPTNNDYSHYFSSKEKGGLPVTEYATDASMRDALRVYFDANGFGPDGGYAAAWVDLKLGPIPIPFPNTDARRRAVRFHDLHHIGTGYQTNYAGEFEISAWEIATGCRDFVAAWQLNLAGMLGGLCVYPLRTFRAFIRGRHTRNFYGDIYEPLLDLSVSAARAKLGTDRPAPSPTFSDVALFALASTAAILVGVVSLVVFVPLGLVAAPFLHLAAKRARAAAPSIPTTPSARAGTSPG